MTDTSNGAVPKPSNLQPHSLPPAKKLDQPQQLFDLIGQPQPQQQQRPVQMLPGLTKAKQPEILQRLSVATSRDDQFPDESFFEMLMKCQGSRIEEQRSSLPAASVGGGPGPVPAVAAVRDGGGDGGPPLDAPTVPDEDFFNLIQRLQSGRLEDQRASLPKDH